MRSVGYPGEAATARLARILTVFACPACSPSVSSSPVHFESTAYTTPFGNAAPAISASLVDLFDVASLADATGPDWLEAAGGIKLPITPRTAINGSVTLSAFSSNVPSVQGDVGLSSAF